MYPQFFVFIDKDVTLEQLGLVKGLIDHGYCPFVDNQRGEQKSWFDDNLKTCEHMLYFFDNENIISRRHGALAFTKPDLLVAFSEGIEVSDGDWRKMYELIKSCNCHAKNVNENLVKEALELFEKPIKAESKQPEKPAVPLPKAYGYRECFIGSVGFYEIVKPNVEEPYVTMVEDYKNFPMDVFTNWFKCQSFGVSNADAAFIYKLYERTNSSEKLDLEKEFEKRVQRVVDGGKEPLVWRNTLENVMDIYTSALEMEGASKRKRYDGGMPRKK
jgi:hypothetical protein